MKWLSFNYRASASPSKKLALKYIVLSKWLDIICLQEALNSSDDIVRSLGCSRDVSSQLLMPVEDRGV